MTDFDVHSSFTPMFLLCKVCALVPLPSTRNLQHYSRVNRVLHFTQSLIFLGLSLVTAVNYITKVILFGPTAIVCPAYNIDFFRGTGMLMTYTIYPLGHILTGMMAYVIAVSQIHNNLPKLLSSIHHVDEQLMIPNDYHKKDKQVITKICLLSVTEFVAMLTGAIVVQQKTKIIKSTFFYCLSHILSYSLLYLEAQFRVCCYLLRRRFYIINRRIFKIRSSPNLQQPERTEAKHMPKIFTVQNVWPIMKTNQLSHLRSCHIGLCDCFRIIGKMSSLQILCSLVCCFFESLIGSYVAVFQRPQWLKLGFTDTSFTLASLVNFIFYVLRIFLLTAAASNLSDEVRKQQGTIYVFQVLLFVIPK